jgi:predicted DCC family thiol-disulfide oxidoreductase YuxK
VNTETTEIKGTRGWIFYDAECPICRKGRKVWGGIFARRGFEWFPLQTPGVAHRLGLSETALLEEMKLQLAGGRVLGGIDSWVVLFRSVWLLWPIGFLLSLPGFHALSRACYRWIARNRYCFGGKCGVRTKPRHRRKIPFLDLP